MAGTSEQQKRIQQYMKVRKRVHGIKKHKCEKPSQKGKPEASSATPADVNEQTDELKLLRKFDLDPSFGPSLDSTRMERWNRAEKLGLDPPTHIKKLIEDHSHEVSYTHSVWQNYNLLSAPAT